MLRFRLDQDASRAKTHVDERSTKHCLCVHPVALVVVASLSRRRRLENAAFMALLFPPLPKILSRPLYDSFGFVGIEGQERQKTTERGDGVRKIVEKQRGTTREKNRTGGAVRPNEVRKAGVLEYRKLSDFREGHRT